MTQHDPAVVFRHMLDYARRARALSAGKSADEIESDEVLSLAIPRALELVGEAATRLDPDQRQTYPQIDWRRLVAFRNVLIHGYEHIDFGIVAEVLESDVPPLLAALEALLAETDGEHPN